MKCISNLCLLDASNMKNIITIKIVACTINKLGIGNTLFKRADEPQKIIP